MKNNYQTSIISTKNCPVYFSEKKLLFADKSYMELNSDHNGNEKWGDVFPMYVYDDNEWGIPVRIRIKWVSITEKKCYVLDQKLDTTLLEKKLNLKNDRGENLYDFISIGLTLYGKVAIWLRGTLHQLLIGWYNAIDVKTINEDYPYLFGFSIEEACQKSLENDNEARKYIDEHGLPDEHYYDHLMQQFTYRLVPKLRWWNSEAEEWWEYDEEMEGDEMPTVDFVEVKCHDGTFDRLRDGSLLNYHEAGKPSRVCVGWHVGKREYSAYFFFSHEELAQVFRTCYGAHPETQVDFLLMIDPECDKYETALFRYGMNEPLPIGPDACQVLVFRNKFECYRSPNYTQPKGAWR